MRKTTKKTARKKNLSTKTKRQYVYNTFGRRFLLKAGRLSQAIDTNWRRAARLSEIREVANTDTPLTVKNYYRNRHVNVSEYRVVYSGNRLNIGCQTFEGKNAAKIAKTARLTV